MSRTSMQQRCWEHDYCAPSFYMITIVTEPRRECLSRLNAESTGVPQLVLSPMGHIVGQVWQRTNSKYEHVRACECVCMPDHFHGILWVRERLERPMGHIVKAFKRVSAGECRSKGLLLPPNRSSAEASGSVPAEVPCAGLHYTLWQDGFQDSILLHKGQLQAMVQYIADNPKRLAMKRAHPELLTVVSQQPVCSGLSCPVIGNRHLLDYPLNLGLASDERLAAGHGQLLQIVSMLVSRIRRKG